MAVIPPPPPRTVMLQSIVRGGGVCDQQLTILIYIISGLSSYELAYQDILFLQHVLVLLHPSN